MFLLWQTAYAELYLQILSGRTLRQRILLLPLPNTRGGTAALEEYRNEGRLD